MPCLYFLGDLPGYIRFISGTLALAIAKEESALLDITSPAVVRQILDEYGLQARKSLGQNFLIDGNVLRKMVDSLDIGPGDLYLEIGPGLGALTLELAQRGARVMAVETDRFLIPWLHRLFSVWSEQVQILNQDILQTDIEAELERHFDSPGGPFAVCANIPYQITSPILFKLLEECPRLSSATLMMQKEVAARILALPGCKEYGRLTVSVAYHGRVRAVMNVSKNCYYPRPEVDSVVLRFEPYLEGKPFPAINESEFKKFLAHAFQHRRKTMLNICSKYYSLAKEEMRPELELCGLDGRLRPESLNLQEYVALVNHMEKIK